MSPFHINVRFTEDMAAAMRERDLPVSHTIREAVAAWALANGVRLDPPQKPGPSYAPAKSGKASAQAPESWRRPLERAVLARKTTMYALAAQAVADYLGVELREEPPEQRDPGWRVSFSMPAVLTTAAAQRGGLGSIARDAMRAWAEANGVGLPEVPDARVHGAKASGGTCARTTSVVLPASWRDPVMAWSHAHGVLASVAVRDAVTRYLGVEMPAGGWFSGRKPKAKSKPATGGHGSPCPVCGGAAMERERRMNEWDAACELGHRWWQDIAGVKSYSHQWAGDDAEDAA